MNNTVLYDISYGMYSVGVKDGSRDCGCIVNTVFQISNKGPLIALSMNKENYTCSCIEKAKRFSTSILPESIDERAITQLGFQSGKEIDKWKGLAYLYFDKLPVLENALGYMICEVVSMADADTHKLFICKVVDAKKGNGKHPMTYAYYHDVLKRQASKNAPTYRPKSKWVCSVCGYVYQGDDFEYEPDDYVCPVCGAKKEKFQLESA